MVACYGVWKADFPDDLTLSVLPGRGCLQLEAAEASSTRRGKGGVTGALRISTVFGPLKMVRWRTIALLLRLTGTSCAANVLGKGDRSRGRRLRAGAEGDAIRNQHVTSIDAPSRRRDWHTTAAGDSAQRHATERLAGRVSAAHAPAAAKQRSLGMCCVLALWGVHSRV